MNHTPGPWTIAPGRDKTHPHNIESRSPECDGFDLARCVLIDDARLIAAAPDLLAALADLLACTMETYDNRHEIAAALDAIAAAKGQQ